MVAAKHNLNGITLAFTNACAAGSMAVGEAYRLIKYGMMDAMLAGGSDFNVLSHT
jgi:3-oxoacyl-[acyl-carrier-protein] synthase II